MGHLGVHQVRMTAPADLSQDVQRLVTAVRRAVERQPALHESDVAGGESLTALALRHGVVAWLPQLPREVVQHHAAAALRGVVELAEVAQYLDAAAIPFVVLKGPTFSAWLYGDASMRRFSDLDLLVEPDRAGDAIRVLCERGFQLPLPAAAADVIYGYIGALPLKHPSRVPVDLHWELAGRRFPRLLSADDVQRAAVEIRLASRALRVPCPTHTAAMTLAHAAKHLWYALENVLAIAMVVRRDDVDWDEVYHVMREAGCVRAGAAGLRLARELFGGRVPAPFDRHVDSPAVAELCECGRQALSLPPYVFPDRHLDRRIHRMFFDRTLDRVRYDVRRVIEPTVADWGWLPLSPALSRLYSPVRVIRLSTLALSGAVTWIVRRPHSSN
jgi:hypothetical protein